MKQAPNACKMSFSKDMKQKQGKTIATRQQNPFDANKKKKNYKLGPKTTNLQTPMRNSRLFLEWSHTFLLHLVLQI